MSTWEAIIPAVATIGGAYLGSKRSEPEPIITTREAGPYEVQRAEQGATIGNILIPYLIKQITGTPTAADKRTLAYQLSEFKNQMGKMGVEPGDPRVAENIRKLMENLNMPKTGLINMLQSIYSGASTDIGSTTTQSGGGTPGSPLTGALQGLTLYKVLNDTGLFNFGMGQQAKNATTQLDYAQPWGGDIGEWGYDYGAAYK